MRLCVPAQVQSCMREYQEKTRKALLARNKAVLTRLHAAQAAKQQNIPSDDGEDADTPGACAGRGKHSAVQGVLAGMWLVFHAQRACQKCHGSAADTL